MILFQFGVELAGAGPPPDAAVDLLFGRCADVVVEFEAAAGRVRTRFDRVAPSPLDAVVSGVRDLDAAGLVALAVGPDDDLITAAGAAARLGLALPCDPTAPAVPRPVWHCAGEPVYRWPEVAAWFGGAVPDADPAVFEAVTLALRARAPVARVGRPDVIRSLIVDVGEGPDGQLRCGG